MKKRKMKNPTEGNLEEGFQILFEHPLFRGGYERYERVGKEILGKESAAIVTNQDTIFLNKETHYTPKEWCHIIAHCRLHLIFGHFDAEKIDECKKLDTQGRFYPAVWNQACDIYVEKFLSDIKLGQAICPNNFQKYGGSISDEVKLYEFLLQHEEKTERQLYGTATENSLDMKGLENPIAYDRNKNQYNYHAAQFSIALDNVVEKTVQKVSGVSKNSLEMNIAVKTANWFINHYPLLGALASSFKIIYDTQVCIREEIRVAAVDVEAGEILINPSTGLYSEELKFVLAHEFLHAGLQHHLRCQGRNMYLWNVACDYVVNGWLYEMKIGEMPEGVLFDKELLSISAEEVYDRIVTDIRRYGKQNTLRGYGKGDMIRRGTKKGEIEKDRKGRNLEDFYRDALAQGLEYHCANGRGLLPAGLVEEIRALAMPVIPWDVKLADWFEKYFAFPEKKRSYARPSRRQGATPDIPRPRYVETDEWKDNKTFGVVIDTSGSMSNKMLAMALGTIASYSAARKVPYARVVFCDAQAYDAGYMSPEDIAGRVEVKGRGGTMIQPGIDLLQNAKDFPKDGPILVITDGEIEDYLGVKRKHAYLLPAGRRLPFRAKGEIFYIE